MMNIEWIEVDITALRVDAIVNAANCGLLGGGGVDGAIHRAGGAALDEACRRLVESLPNHRGVTGEAYVTTAGRLSCSWVVHTAGPVYRDGRHGEPELLAACYRNSLLRAEELRCGSLAFPCISTGVYGYPLEEAAAIAVATVRRFEPVYLHRVIFCCFNHENAAIYRRLIENLIP